MDDYLNHIAEALFRAIKKSVSLLGIGGIFALWIVEQLLFNEGNMNLLAEVIVAFLGVFAIFAVWELRAKFVWVDLKPLLENDIKHNGVKRATIVIESHEASDLHCYARLIEAYSFQPIEIGGEPMWAKIPYRSGKLKWYSEKDCEVVIPPLDKSKRVVVAGIQNFISFSYCDDAHHNDGYGLYVVKVRIDGKCRGREIFPCYFNGYLYIQNIVDETTKHIIHNRIFRTGDWTKDNDIPQWYRERKILEGEEEG